MNEPLEKIIRETLQTEKPPELSPFFVSRVVNQIKSNGEESRFARPILIASWCIGSFLIVFLLTNFVWSAWFFLAILILVPISFALTILREIKD